MTTTSIHSDPPSDARLDPSPDVSHLGDDPRLDKPLRSAKHYAWLDGLRVFAIIDIVGKHSIGQSGGYYPDGMLGIISPQHPFSGIGLPIFILCTIALTAKRDRPRPFKQMVHKKAVRLLIPWALWSVFYVLFELRRARLRGDELTQVYTVPELLFFGGTLGLWYLVFAFVAESIVNAIQHASNGLEHRRPITLALSWLLAGAALLTLTPHLITYAPRQSLVWYIQHTWLLGMMLVPIGIGLGLLIRDQGASLKTRLILYSFGVAFIMLSTMNVQLIEAKMHAIVWQGRTGIALVLVAAALSIRANMPKPLVFLGAYTFTIYLVHFFVLGQFENRITGIIGEDKPWLFFALIYAMSLVAAIVLKKLPVIRRYC